MIDPFKDYIDIGYVQRPHGTQGEVIIDLLYKFESLDHFAVDLEGSRVPFRIEACSLVEKKAYIKLYGIKSLSDIEFIKGRRVFLKQAYIPQEEILLQSIIEYKAIDERTGFLGKVIAVSNMPLQRMIHIQSQEKSGELLVPYHPRLIQRVDHLQKKIFTQLPENFL